MPQPAYKLYPLGRGWRIIGIVINGHIARSHALARRWQDHATSLRYLAARQFWPLRLLAWLAIAGFFVASVLQYLPHILLALLFLLLYPPMLLLWLGIDLLSLLLLTATRIFYSTFSGISYHCPTCYKRVAIPAHRCSTCAIEHTLLRPSLYGVLTHRCKACETYLPTLDLFGRKQLTRVCPHCHHPLNNEFGRGLNIHIALLGAPGAGKTTYTTSALHALTLPELHTPHTPHTLHHLKITLPDLAQDEQIKEAPQPISDQHVTTDIPSLSPQVHLAGIQISRTWLSRCFYLYDPVGETLRSDSYMSRQEYYTYAHGIIFVIDPFSIPAYFQRYQHEIEAAHLHCSPNNLEVMRVYERMMRVLETSSERPKSYRGSINKQIAVVLTKVDALHPNQLFPPSSTAATQQEQNSDLAEQDIDHHKVREFLCAYGLDNLVRDIEAHFANVHYFSCSPLEDLADQHQTKRLLVPLLWLLTQAKAI